MELRDPDQKHFVFSARLREPAHWHTDHFSHYHPAWTLSMGFQLLTHNCSHPAPTVSLPSTRQTLPFDLALTLWSFYSWPENTLGMQGYWWLSLELALKKAKLEVLGKYISFILVISHTCHFLLFPFPWCLRPTLSLSEVEYDTWKVSQFGKYSDELDFFTVLSCPFYCYS